MILTSSYRLFDLVFLQLARHLSLEKCLLLCQPVRLFSAESKFRCNFCGCRDSLLSLTAVQGGPALSPSGFGIGFRRLGDLNLVPSLPSSPGVKFIVPPPNGPHVGSLVINFMPLLTFFFIVFDEAG
jgi:hypothetical protein